MRSQLVAWPILKFPLSCDSLQLAKEFTLERLTQRVLKAELAAIEKGVRDMAHKKLAGSSRILGSE